MNSAGATTARRWILRAALAMYVLVLATATHAPKSTIEKWTPDGPHGIDKVFHLAAYAGLGMLAAAVWHGGRSITVRSVAVGLCCLAVFAAADEALQAWPGLEREADLWDYLADLTGGGLGWGLLLAVQWAFGPYQDQASS